MSQVPTASNDVSSAAPPAAKAWQGRFSEGTDASVERFTESIKVDVRLAPHDVEGSAAHVAMLAKVGLVTEAEAEAITAALYEILADLQRGALPLQTQLEDVHMHIEHALIERLGETGRKLHTGRSRNDQVATALRLWTRDALDRTIAAVKDAMQGLVDFAEREVATIIPAYTHLQRAQPILAAHSFLAHVERLGRDLSRLEDARRRVNVLPLGSAAACGSTLPLDRDEVARHLGFAAVARNSLDATSDRDFVAESIFALSLIATHMSGLAEEWILWTTSEFGFLVLPDRLCTGSSIMPQKRNPDVLELIRGRTGRVTGSLMNVLTLLKGLPLAYNRDLQEDKTPLFDAFDTVLAALPMIAKTARESRLDGPRIAAGMDVGYLDATTLMEALIKEGVAMRRAHEIVGRLVRTAEELRVPLAGLPDDEFTAAHPSLTPELARSVLGATNAVHSYVTQGSSAPAAVAREISNWKAKLS